MEQHFEFEDYCIKSGIGIKKLFNIINDLPRDETSSLKYEQEYPQFITYILEEGNISDKAGIDFMERIGIRYLKSSFFSKNC